MQGLIDYIIGRYTLRWRKSLTFKWCRLYIPLWKLIASVTICFLFTQIHLVKFNLFQWRKKTTRETVLEGKTIEMIPVDEMQQSVVMWEHQFSFYSQSLTGNCISNNVKYIPIKRSWSENNIYNSKLKRWVWAAGPF